MESEGAETTTDNEVSDIEEIGTPLADSTKVEKSIYNSISKMNRVLISPHATYRTSKYYTQNKLPKVHQKSGPYSPILYTFRVRGKGDIKYHDYKRCITKPPPFHVLFDHCIAVIWTLFSPNTNQDTLGPPHLHWALYFLYSIRNSRGDHTEDIKSCIDAIQERLIDIYADMSEHLVMYNQTPIGKYAVEKEPPFSFNYHQMSKCYTGAASKTGALSQVLQELENMSRMLGLEKFDLRATVSKENVITILADWRTEQMSKIEKQIDELHTVEDMMKNVDEKSFTGFTNFKAQKLTIQENEPEPPTEPKTI